MKLTVYSVDNITPYEKNSKIHSKGQIESIARSISRFGWDQPIVVDRFGVIIKGHGRLAAAKLLGLNEVPVLIRDDLSPEEVRAARIADNQVALGGFDMDLLKDELADLMGITDEIGFADMGFSDDFSLDDLGGPASDFDDDPLPNPALLLGMAPRGLGEASGASAESSEDEAPDEDDEGGGEYVTRLQVLVKCNTEAEQQQVYQYVTAMGLKCLVQQI